MNERGIRTDTCKLTDEELYDMLDIEQSYRHTVIPSQLHHPQTTQCQGRRQKVSQDLQAKEGEIEVLDYLENNDYFCKTTNYQTLL